MEIPWESVAKWALLFILSFAPAVHAGFMQTRYGITASGTRSTLRVNLYNFGLISTTVACTVLGTLVIQLL